MLILYAKNFTRLLMIHFNIILATFSKSNSIILISYIESYSKVLADSSKILILRIEDRECILDYNYPLISKRTITAANL